MACRKNTPGQPCCGDCGACSSVDIPLSVTLIPPYSINASPPAETTWDLTDSVTNTVCESYRADGACTSQTNFTTLRDRICRNNWPAFNANDAKYTVGAVVPDPACGSCGSAPPPATVTISYEEQQESSRRVRKQKKSYTPSFSLSHIDPNFIHVRLQVVFGEAIANSVIRGVRNRITFATYACPSAVVSSNTGWLYAPEPIFPDPRMCFFLGQTFCDGALTPNTYFEGSCDLVTSVAGSESICTSLPVYFETKIAESTCNIQVPFADQVPPIILCTYVTSLGVFTLQGQSSARLSENVFSVIWSATVPCADLYAGPIVLTGGPPSGSITVSDFDLLGNPIYGDEAEPGCTDSITPIRRIWTVPTTISVTINR